MRDCDDPHDGLERRELAGEMRADQRRDAERDEPRAPRPRRPRQRRMSRDFSGPYETTR